MYPMQGRIHEHITCTLSHPHTHHNCFTALFRDHPGEPVPEENFWTLWCKGRLTEADTLIIWLGATLSGLTSAHLHHPPIFLRARCPSCRPTNSVKALKAYVHSPNNSNTMNEVEHSNENKGKIPKEIKWKEKKPKNSSHKK